MESKVSTGTKSSAGNIDIYSSLIMGMSSISNAYFESQSEKAMGEYQSAMYRINARMAEFQASQAVAKGDREAKSIREQGRRYANRAILEGKKVSGEQRSALAAQGIDINAGSARDVGLETEAISELNQMEILKSAELDALTVKNNAWREAWGLKMQATEYGQESTFASMTAKNKANTTLVTGGLRALAYGVDAYGKYKSTYPSIKSEGKTVKTSLGRELIPEIKYGDLS